MTTLASTEQSETDTKIHGKLNWLRAGVLGANDGIVSTAGLVMGVAGANVSSHALLIAGLAGVVAGALSMAGGEYVSVSSQKDTELAALEAGRKQIRDDPEGELQRPRGHLHHQGRLPRAVAPGRRADDDA